MPSAPKFQQSRPQAVVYPQQMAQAVTYPQQMAQMQTMVPRPIISAPQGFRKPMQMTQATVSIIEIFSEIDRRHQLTFLLCA